MFRSSMAGSPFLIFIMALFLLTGCAAITPNAKPDYTAQPSGMDFVYVKGGTFQMGSTTRSDEQPIHSVTIQSLFVGMYEVTFDQYDSFAATTGRKKPADQGWGRGDRPVINVSWNDANDYAAWLSKQTGQLFRLPSEAEWEYIARAGTTTPFWTGETLLPNSANCAICGSKWDNKETAPVGSFGANRWGVFDTSGNVTEWVLDDYKHSYADVPADGSAVIIDKSVRKVQRGGAWDYSTRELRSAARDYRRTSATKSDTGFRLVLIPSDEGPLPPGPAPRK